MRSILLIFLTLLAFIPKVTYGQVILKEFSSSNLKDQFSRNASYAGDFDSDSVPDYFIPAQSSPVTFATTLYSGRTKQVISVFPGILTPVRIGDFNNDSHVDFIMCSITTCNVLSGVDWAQILGPLNNDIFPIVVGDVDHDGYPELLIGSGTGLPSDPYKFLVKSGFDGTILKIIPVGYYSQPELLGDINGDGLPEIIYRDLAGSQNIVKIISIPSGALVRSHSTDSVNTDGYVSNDPAAGKDFDGDGIPDYSLRVIPKGLSIPTDVALFSGSDGHIIRTFLEQSPGDDFGSTIKFIGDMNGDGVPEIGIGAIADSTIAAKAGKAYIYSGKTGALLFSLDGSGPNQQMGTTISDAGDFNGDGINEVLLGAPGDYNYGLSVGQVKIVAYDNCPGDLNKVAPGQCGCGFPDTDSDGDGVADCVDLCVSDPHKVTAGICGCGIDDTDSDSDGTPNCNDQCLNDPNKVQPGLCGCGVSDSDLNGNGIVDCLDLNVTSITPIAPKIKAGKGLLSYSLTALSGVTYYIRLEITPPPINGKRGKTRTVHYQRTNANGVIRKLKSGTGVVFSYRYALNGNSVLYSNTSPKRRAKIS